MSASMKHNAASRPVAVVTGGLQGLGLGIACDMLGSGFDVAVIDLAEEALLPGELAAPVASGGSCRYYQLDIADLDRHDDVLAAIEADFGRLDCLVNNAGIAARPLTDILELDAAAFDKSVDVNLRGTFFLTQAFANRLLASGPVEPDAYRSIITISSIAAELAFVDRSQYCVTKAALSMVTKLFGARLGAAGIYVHEVRPGLMRTAMTAAVGSDTIEQLLANGTVPVPRWGTPEDVGRTVCSLASGALPYMTGQPIWTAGGLNIPRII